MKNLLACLAILAAFNVTAQVDGFQLPYNPDSEPDGYIGVADVLEVLTIFGSQWNASDIYLSNDSTSMTMFVGQMIYPLCLAACADLPGSWQISSLTDLGRIWDELPSGEQVYFKPETPSVQPSAVNLYGGTTIFNPTLYSSNYCYCSTQERPKVEYLVASSGVSELDSSPEMENFLNAKAQDGWHLMPTPASASHGANKIYLWRWAD